jgi:hypothetical protein
MDGREMTHIETKCNALLLCRMYTRSRKEGTITAEWLRKWQLTNEQETPPQSWKPLEKPKYPQVYALDMAYIRHEDIREKIAKLRQHMYRQLKLLAQARTGIKDMRIETMYPNTRWTWMWKNLQEFWTTDAIRAKLYNVIHDIVSINVRLARINLSDTDRCRLCGRRDTLNHRLTVCMEMKDIWDRTRRRIGLMPHTDPKNIPLEWTIMPSFVMGPPQKRRAILWVLAHMIYYCQQKRTQLSLTDFQISYGVRDGKHTSGRRGRKELGGTCCCCRGERAKNQ